MKIRVWAHLFFCSALVCFMETEVCGDSANVTALAPIEKRDSTLAAVDATDYNAIQKLKNLESQSFVLAEKKSNLLVVFWATWCADCKAHLKKDLVKLALRKDLDVITINTDEDAARAKNFVSKEKVTLPVYREEGSWLFDHLNVTAVPFWALYKKAPGGLDKLHAQAVYNEEKILALLK